MPSRYRSGGLGKANLFDTNVKATQIDEDIFTDQEVLTSIADNDLILLLDVSEDPDEIKYMTKANLISGLPTLTGTTNNTVVTVTGASAIAGEANLLFDGTILTNDGGEIDIDISSGDPHLSFQIGGTDEFTIGVDDSDSDIFKIDTGGTVGGATKLSIDTSGNVIIAGGLTTGSTSFVNSSGVIQVASQTNITGVGTISTGVWQGTAIASAYLDSDTAHLSGTQTISGVKTFSSGFARGSDAEGDILYSNGTAYVRLARGSDDQVLTLASGVPSWATPTVGDITGVTAGVGLSGGGTTGGVTLTLDLSELSDVTPANGDKLSTLDSDGANEQLTTVASLATLFAGTGLTASSSVIGVNTSQAITTLTGGDLTIYEDANNADVSLKMGTSATESLSIEVLNGGSNKTAEEVRITTATASGTANHGKIAIYIDGAEILDIDDGGIDMASGMTVALNGTDIVSASGANTAITSIYNTSLKMGRDSENLIDFATTDNKIILRVNNVDEVELVENALSPVTSDGVALGTGSLMWSDLFLASASVVNFNNGDVVLTHASNTLTLTGGDFVIGVDDTGHDVKFFGASAGAYMEWDESADQLRIMGASADATTSTGKLLLATSLTDINANDVIGKVDFQAPHEAGGTDAITVAASIQAIAQDTFSSSVNATDLVFYTGHSEAATEKFRFTSQGEIGIGGTNYGTDGQVLTSGGAGAAAAWEDAGGGGTLDFVADGAIANGDAVALNSDGTISPCDDATVTTTQGFGTVTASNKFTTNTCNTLLAVWEDNANKVVFVWRDESDSNKGKSVVGTVSGDTISYGSVAEVDDGQIRFHGICFDSSNNKVVASYYDSDNSNQGTAIVGTVSGTSISWGTAVIYNTGATYDAAVVFDSNSNKVVIGARDAGSGNAWGIVGTVSGTGISFGSESSAFESGNTYYLNGTFDSNLNKVVIAFSDENNSSYGTSVVGTVSGTDITFGSQVIFESARADYIGLTFDSDLNKVVITYQDTGNSNHGTAIVGTVSGTSISYGTAVVFAAASSARMAYGTVYDTNINKVIVVFSDAANSSYPTGVIGAVSGTTITFSSETTFESAYNIHPSTVFDSTNNKLIIGQAGNSTVDGAALVVGPPVYTQVTTYNTTNFIGVAAAAISDTATGSINIMGSVNESLTSLTVGAKYYLQVNGTIATTATDKEIGRAIASTKLLITKAQAASGGGMNFIASSGALSGVASVEFTQFNSSLYDHYVFWIQHIHGVSDDVFLMAHSSTDGGNNYSTTNGDYHYNGSSDATGFYINTHGLGNAAAEYGISGRFELYAPHDANNFTYGTSFITQMNTNGTVNTRVGDATSGGARLAAEDVDAIQFKFTSGNIQTGEIVMYGIKSV